MSLISESLQARYAEVSKSAVASINRHPQPAISEELQMLVSIVSESDERDSYGVGGLVQQFEQQLCGLFNKLSCVFLPTGTLAQCVAMKCHSEQSGKTHIGLHPTSHLLLHEHMAIEQLWGLHSHSVGNSHRVLTSQDVAELDPNNTAAVIVELPMREIGGELSTWQELIKIRNWCDANSVKMHMDGARVWQTTQYYQRSLAEIAAIFDSVYVSFYKDLGGIFGAALLGENELIQNAKIWARRAGGNPITQYPEVLAARYGLVTYLNRIPEYVEYAKAMSDKLKSLPLSIVPEEPILPLQPATSMFHIQFKQSPEALTKRIVLYAENTGVLVLPLPRSGDQQNCICEVTVGENALAKPPEFWLEHIEACLRL